MATPIQYHMAHHPGPIQVFTGENTAPHANFLVQLHPHPHTMSAPHRLRAHICWLRPETVLVQQHQHCADPDKKRGHRSEHKGRQLCIQGPLHYEYYHKLQHELAPSQLKILCTAIQGIVDFRGVVAFDTARTRRSLHPGMRVGVISHAQCCRVSRMGLTRE